MRYLYWDSYLEDPSDRGYTLILTHAQVRAEDLGGCLIGVDCDEKASTSASEPSTDNFAPCINGQKPYVAGPTSLSTSKPSKKGIGGATCIYSHVLVEMLSIAMLQASAH